MSSKNCTALPLSGYFCPILWSFILCIHSLVFNNRLKRPQSEMRRSFSAQHSSYWRSALKIPAKYLPKIQSPSPQLSKIEVLSLDSCSVDHDQVSAFRQNTKTFAGLTSFVSVYITVLAAYCPISVGTCFIQFSNCLWQEDIYYQVL